MKHLESKGKAMDRQMKAKELFSGGCNCCQAVFAAFCDETGMTRETALKLSAPFGGGMGRLREVCGAVTAMFMTAGLKYGYTDCADEETKMRHYADIRELARRFENEYGSIICRKLLDLEGKSVDTPVPHGAVSPCGGFVEGAAEILEQWLKEKQNSEK